MSVCMAEPFLGESVEVRRAHRFCTITGQVAVTDVVRIDEYDIGRISQKICKWRGNSEEGYCNHQERILLHDNLPLNLSQLFESSDLDAASKFAFRFSRPVHFCRCNSVDPIAESQINCGWEYECKTDWPTGRQMRYD